MCPMGRKKIPIFTALLASSLWVATVAAQEITPRLFWPAPKDTTVLVAGYSHSTGAVFFDASVPIEDADADIDTGVLAYLRTLDLWGRSSNILFSLPYAKGTARGLLEDDQAQTDFGGFGDLSVTLNVNLRGAPTMNMEGFDAFRADPQNIVGVSLKLIAPTGQYDRNRLVNVGLNRWTARLKFGTVLVLQPSWLLELSASGWFFGDDPDFLNGRKEQDPLYTLESSVIKRLRPGLWASLDMSFYRGGRQTLDGNRLDNKQRNLKVGGTLVVPFLGRHAIKIGYANGVITRYGEDFNQFLLSYQVVVR